MSSIYLYTYNKETNSTSTPIGGGTQVTGSFREPVDVLNPVVRVEDSMSIMTNKYNIAHISELNRWYWITNIIWITEDIAELHLKVDVLSTYKTQIGASTQYVLRADASWNAYLVDNLYPVKSDQSCEIASITAIPWYNPNGYVLANGWYIVGIMNQDNNAVGSTSFYCLNDTAFQSLRYQLFHTTGYTNMQFTQIEEPLYKSLFNPMQYISSVIWMPMQPDITGLYNISTLQFGFFSIALASGSECYRLRNFVKSGSFSLSNKKHPNASTRGNYLNASPFLHRTLYIPPVGSIELDTAKMTGDNMVPTIYWYVDFLTGEVRIRVVCNQNDGAIVGDAVGQLGINVSLAQATQDITGWASGVAQASAGGFSSVIGLMLGNGSMVSSGLSSAANGLANAASALAPNVSAIPGKGGLLNGDIIPYDLCTYTTPANDNKTLKGRPLCNTEQLSNLPGYILCSDAHIAISGALFAEEQEIDNFLNNGFFYH